MHLIEFVASEHITGEVELDYDTTLTDADAKELAIKEIQAMYPEYDNVEIVKVERIN